MEFKAWIFKGDGTVVEGCLDPTSQFERRSIIGTIYIPNPSVLLFIPITQSYKLWCFWAKVACTSYRRWRRPFSSCRSKTTGNWKILLRYAEDVRWEVKNKHKCCRFHYAFHIGYCEETSSHLYHLQDYLEFWNCGLAHSYFNSWDSSIQKFWVNRNILYWKRCDMIYVVFPDTSFI